MAVQGASSSSSSTSPWTHDVFLSFRGKDTSDNFTAHLHKALLQKGINTFIDDEIRTGEEISPAALVEAIQKSRISIVVFSQTYASSKWCLDEVLEILECKKTKNQMVLPVFYKVDPSDVRYQMKSFEKALVKHEERFKDDLKVQRWKAALKQVADLRGYCFASGNEAKFIDEIVQNVSRIVNRTYLHVAKHPVEIEFRVQEINSLLSIHEMNNRRMVGILGAGVIGKTRIAKDIYNSIYSQFDGCCFLESVREASKKRSGLVELQNKLLSTILRVTVKVDSVAEGNSVIKRRLCSKKVLLILDDVDHKEQLEKLAGGDDWFGLGSRIIITTRDRKVLIDHKVNDDQIFRMNELDKNEALELFSWNAFKGAKPTERMTSSLAFRGASSSFSSTHQWTHDVFLSFRGKDTRRNFTAYLYDALDRRGINTYLGDEQLESEENILPALVKIIEESRISVIVVSQNYASSPRCLDELTTILECKKTNGQIILPVFYKIDPSDVQQLQSSFGEAFVKLEQRFKDDQRKVHKWKTALTHVANLLGYHLDDRDEAQCVDEIVEKITNHIKATKQVAKHPIAITSPLHVPDSSSSPAQVPDSSSSPSRVGIESPAQAPDSPRSPSSVEIQAPVQVVNLSSSPSGNGEQGSNPSISSELGSNLFKSILQVIEFYIGSVIGIKQLDDFATHPVNIWISHAALAMFCLSWANMLKTDGTRWAKYSRINKIFCVLSGLLIPVSLISIHLPHQLWWLFFVIWALLGFIFVANTWIYSGANRRNVEEIGLMMSLIRPTNSYSVRNFFRRCPFLTPYQEQWPLSHSSDMGKRLTQCPTRKSKACYDLSTTRHL